MKPAKTRLEILCDIHGQQGGTIHDFNHKYAFVHNEVAREAWDFTTLSNKAFFKFIYCIQLKRAHAQFPDLYSWPSGELMNVMIKMSAAIDKGSFNKDSAAFKLTCKALGIKHTYMAIAQYLNGMVQS